MPTTVQTRPFGQTSAGEQVHAYTLISPTGLIVELLTYGATISRIQALGRVGRIDDIALGYETLAEYEAGTHYFGCTVGRYANRIAGGMFALDGITYRLAANNGSHHLHGGISGYDRRVWTAEPVENGVKMSLFDEDMTENFPGNVQASITFTLVENALRLEYQATADKPTPINLTNHTYFNLDRAGSSTILNHLLHVDAVNYTPVDAALIPTGELSPVTGRALDFTSPKPLGHDLARTGEMNGYDHNFVLKNPGQFTRVATLSSPTSGRKLETWTTEPGLQIYTGNFLSDQTKGRGGTFPKHSAICLETQHFPDSPNRSAFPNTILRPGETFSSVTEYRFSVG